MYDSSLALSRIGIILNIDADVNDPLFREGVNYVHKNFTTLFNPTQTSLLRKFLDKVFTSGKLQCIEFFHGPNFYQLKCVVSQPGQAVCIITNNTRHRKVLMELEEHNLQTLADTYLDWVWSFDTNFSLVTANKAFLDARHKLNSKTLAVGDNIFKDVDDSVYKKWMPIYERALKGETITFEEKRNYLGLEIYVEVYLSPVYNAHNNEIIGCLGVTRDITGRKNALLAAESYNAKLVDFAFKTSYELRRPVANIIGMANLLSDGEMDEDEKNKGVRYILQSANELDKAVTGMIEIAGEHQTMQSKAV